MIYHVFNETFELSRSINNSVVYADDEKWENRSNECNRTVKFGTCQNAWSEGKLQVVWNIESGHNQTNRQKKKKKGKNSWER